MKIVRNSSTKNFLDKSPFYPDVTLQFETLEHVQISKEITMTNNLLYFKNLDQI